MRILVAEDHPLDRSMLKIALEKWNYEVIECDNGDDALRILLQDDAPRLAVLDWMMPGLDGPDICREVRKNDLECYTYILLLTSKGQKDDLVAGLRAGADDYVVKPVDMHELRVRLRAGRRIVDLQNDLIVAREALRFQAMHDYLTGLPNRAAITSLLTQEMSRSMREDHELSVVMGDIDHFKSINDTYGHPVGDAVLREVAQRMLAAIRAYDSVGRYGGEEFLAVIPGTDVEGADIVAERIRHTVAETPIKVGDIDLDVTISLGVASRAVNKIVEPTDLIMEADKALYLAKDSGRNRVVRASVAGA